VDPISNAFHAKDFRIAFLTNKGTAFQDWFAELAGHALGSDFEAVRPYGNQGDWKCDGRQKSTGTVFQCYAPESISDKNTITKIDEDLAGAVEKWPDFINLDIKRSEYSGLDIEIWLEPNLLDLFNMMSANAKRLMFGVAPTQGTFSLVSLSDLEPVISALESREPGPSEEVPPPPSALKLEKNALSDEASALLRFGRLKVRLVETYFGKNVRVELGEKIAEAFRDRYAELQALDLSADQVFTYLQKFSGVSGEPKRQAAAMAVMAYYFDRCDIFEDPDEEAVDT